MTGLTGLNPLKRIEEQLKSEPVLTGFIQLARSFIPGRYQSIYPRKAIVKTLGFKMDGV
jgi:hypothetical protein